MNDFDLALKNSVAIYDKNLSKQEFEKCDKYDYLIAVGCGSLAGLVDIFLVGSPADSKLLKWSDNQVDIAVKKFAKLVGWNPRKGNENNVKSAIGFLEKNYNVVYDQRHSGDIGNAFKMNTKNHHMKSLAHSPDVIGLFFSILNQFTSTATFLDNGKLITVDTETQELLGHNFVSKLFCGTTNWIGHVMSDVAGSSGAKGRGSGLPMPFYSLFGLCNFGSFKDDKYRNTLSKVATKTFEKGYDFRFGMTMSIPVVLCDLSIRLMWSLKRYFYHHDNINNCIPTDKHADLRMMLIVGNATLCVFDGVDAMVRSGGNAVMFFMRFNLVAWYRFISIVLRELKIRYGDKFLEMSKNYLSEIGLNDRYAIELYNKRIEMVDQKLNIVLVEFVNMIEKQHKNYLTQLDGSFNQLYTSKERVEISVKLAKSNNVQQQRILNDIHDLDEYVKNK